MNIQTVTGEVSGEDLGFVLVHEHVFHDLYAITVNSQLILNDTTIARRELEAFKAAGETLWSSRQFTECIRMYPSLRQLLTTLA